MGSYAHNAVQIPYSFIKDSVVQVMRPSSFPYGEQYTEQFGAYLQA